MSTTIRPFTRMLDTVACYAFRGHEEAFARLNMAVAERQLGVLTGEVGSGKSALLRRLFRSLDPMATLPVYLSQSSLKPRDFYSELLRQVGEVPPYSLPKARRLWEEVLQQREAQGDRSLLVVVDEAHEMSEAMLLELRFAMGAQMDAHSYYPVILAGQPELRKTLRLKKYEAVAQRVGMQYHLAGMTRDETGAYVKHHMKTAGLERPVFSDSALQMIHAASQGIPRVVNLICTHALYEAEGKGYEVVEEMHIGRVRADLDKQPGAAG